MKNYKEIEITDFAVTSSVLQECIENRWNSVELGKRDSIFDEYYIFFDQGINVKTINNKIYNMVFNKNYKENVVNSLFPGVDLETVKRDLGKPTFEDESLEVFGYKGKDLYVFFSKDEISVYRILDETSSNEFFDLADKFINEEFDLLDFMNQLTYMWPDYDKYEYSSTSVFISYPLKGIEIKINYDDTNGILVYNNIKSDLIKVQRYLEDTNFVARLQIDSVYEAEKRRFKNNQSLSQKCTEYKNNIENKRLENIGESFRYDIYADIDENGNIYSMKFISKDGNNPNRELNDSIDSYLWIDNDTFVYSKKGKGIYIYNLNDGTIRRIIEGTEKYELKSFKNRILNYDEKQILI